jgi:hypothetical protein
VVTPIEAHQLSKRKYEVKEVIIHKPHLLTTLDIWAPRYSDAYTDTNERVALLAKYKVDNASPVILIKFTKAKHLEGQRFCISRQAVQRYQLDTNGKIPCYAVPLSAFEGWETPAEVRDLAFSLFE